MAAFIEEAAGAEAWEPTPAQQQMLGMEIPETLRTLGQMLRSSGVACEEKSYRRLGLNPDDGNLYYVTFCGESRNYLVRVRRDEKGSWGAMDCHALKTMSGLNCETMKKFSP
jgi:hypothetical protein